MYGRKIILTFIWLLFFYPAKTQPPDLIFKQITQSNGLPVEVVTCLAQDSSGFIWIGSEEGLFRYDGFDFKGYHFEPENKNSIPVNSIAKIYVTRKGLLWLATIEGGIACINDKGNVIRVINSSNNSLFTKESDYVVDIKEDKFGNIWCTTLDGLFRVSVKDGKVARFLLNPALPRFNSFTPFVFDASGKLWFGSLDAGLMVFDPANGSFTYASNPPYNYEALKNRNAYATIAFQKGRIWFCDWALEVGVFDTATKKEVILYSDRGLIQKDRGRMVNTFYVDSKGNLWTGTWGGLNFTSNTLTFEKRFFSDADNRLSIIDNYVLAILEDREGNFWFGTKNGISIAQPYKKQIRNLSSHNSKQYPFGDKEISDVIEVDSSTLLVCTTGADGIYETDLDFNLKKKYSFRNVNYDWIWKYYHDKPRNRIFISTQHGMLLYNTQSHSIKKINPKDNYNINTVSSFVATSDSIVWMSRFRNSFLKYNLKNDTYKEYNLESLGVEKQNILLTKDKENKIWIIAHTTGLFRFDENKEKITQRLIQDTKTNSLLQTAIWFFEDLGENYLIGYRSKGVGLYNKKDKTFRHLGQIDGMVSDNTNTALVTKTNKVWIGTTNGLSLFDPVTGSFKNYGYANGSLHNNILCITQLQDERIVAGTDAGLVVFNPKNFDSVTLVYAPVITGINVYGKDISMDSLLLQKTPLRISYKKNYVAFNFIAPQYNNKEQIQYAYKLEGVDNDWVECGNRRFTSYSNINGGNYTFKIKARMPGGDWVENKNYLSVNVSSPFYSQWWFYLICIIMIALIGYIIFQYRLQQSLRIERMRSNISSDLHDEVGATLTAISIISEMAKKLVSPFSKEGDYLRRIGDRSRDSIEKMSDIIWSINPDNDNIEQMLIRMKNFATEMAEAKEIAVNWTGEGDLTVLHLNMEQRKHFYLLFKEIMNNSIKYADAKKIDIRLTVNGNHICLQVKDDGKGFNMANVSRGNGLKNLHHRAGLLKGSISIKSEEEKGTVVKLEFLL